MRETEVSSKTKTKKMNHVLVAVPDITMFDANDLLVREEATGFLPEEFLGPTRLSRVLVFILLEPFPH